MDWDVKYDGEIAFSIIFFSSLLKSLIHHLLATPKGKKRKNARLLKDFLILYPNLFVVFVFSWALCHRSYWLKKILWVKLFWFIKKRIECIWIPSTSRRMWSGFSMYPLYRDAIWRIKLVYVASSTRSENQLFTEAKSPLQANAISTTNSSFIRDLL